MIARKGATDSLRLLEALMTAPGGLTVDQVCDELGWSWHRANQRVRCMLREGFVEIAGTAPKRSRMGHEPALFRVGPRLRSVAMDAAVHWREELVGKRDTVGVPAFPRERRV